MYEYRCKILRIVDGDTVDIDIDLGFGVVLSNERVRVAGIDTPESRTSDPIEKVFGKAASARIAEMIPEGSNQILLSSDFKGKFGRVLGTFVFGDTTVSDQLVLEGHAVPYLGQSKDDIEQAHLDNRQRLITEGKVVI